MNDAPKPRRPARRDNQEQLCKFSLGSVDDVGLTVVAQYNPGSIQYERAVPWTTHQHKQIEFGGWQGRIVTVELLFDGVEERRSIAPMCDLLEQLSMPIDPGSKRAERLRPHFCVATWGDDGMPTLKCVIENVTTKYMYWSPAGTPMRALCTVKLRESDILTAKERDGLKADGEIRRVVDFFRKL